WFGEAPGHEALTAYGLMEFADMASVYKDVDKTMIERTRAWLMSRRDGKGGFQRSEKAVDSFGRASDEVTNAYITWALSEAGEKNLDAEIEWANKIARTTKDPYVLALAANALANVDPKGDRAANAMQRLVKMQDKDGFFGGAKESITMS